ncbi:MAG: adenylate/guanylate cyclase domain-containing protein, partial [Verrucomicrobiota bacterium]|nr:adenylate/guanylate cyclase domain-containing protein [Verrucomicrobiota bacterium]
MQDSGQQNNPTFVFTDIEGSSRLWEQHPRAMGEALARHDALLREVFTGQSGQIFKTIGDAFCVAFGSAPNALSAALDAQRAVTHEAWEETVALRVRVAMHSGAAEVRDGDYFGPALNRVSRLLAAGHGGQTLLSRATADRVREQLPTDVSLRDLGERRLKDLSQPERIFQLIAPDLPSEFPPLRSLEVLPNNLPAQLTTFIGREWEMTEVKRLLGTTRLLTLTGAGGTGKTRLSLQVAAEVLDSFPHGVWLAELATLSDPELVTETVADVVGIREEADRPLLSTLIDSLRARKLLLLIDNCEHLIAACARLSETLLRNCAELQIVATSREPLGIAGETTWVVPSLSLPETWTDRSKLPTAEIAQFETVQLFVDRAGAVRPGFALTDENANVIATICYRLDGIPLAIELAAARVKMLTPRQILARLDDRFRFLNAGSRTALPRQQTLGAMIDWSYDLLSEKERTLLRRLAVFARGRTLEMVETVCSGNGIEPAEVLDLLASLVDKSLVSAERGTNAEARYFLLESVWDYAREKLQDSDECPLFRVKHLDYFLRFAEDLADDLTGPRQLEALEKIETENTNLRQALEWSAESGHGVERGLRLATALGRYWEVRGSLTEAGEQFATLLALPGATERTLVLARALEAAGRIAWSQDRNLAALRFFSEAFRIFSDLKMPSAIGLMLGFIGFAERSEGHLVAAHAHFDQAHKIAREENDEKLMAVAISGLGNVAADEGDLEKAAELKQRSLEIYRRLGDKWVIGLISWSAGRVAVLRGDYESARAFFAENITISQELGNKWSMPYALEGLADIAIAEEEFERAACLY